MRGMVTQFGPLEAQVMDAVWRENRPTTVRILQDSFPRIAYTTLMTTLDRLHKKGVLKRNKVGRAFAYEPIYERPEIEIRQAARSIEQLLGAARGRGTLEPLLSCFIDTVSERDRMLLDDLERILREKRAAVTRGEPS